MSQFPLQLMIRRWLWIPSHPLEKFRRKLLPMVGSLLIGAMPCISQAEITTVFDVFPIDPMDGEDVFIGDVSLGYLTIDQGSLLVSDDVIIGNEREAIGFATVRDFISEWSTLDLTVGENGIGHLEIFDGALVDVDFAGGVADLVIGRNVGSHGEILVSGFQTILSMGDDTTVGLNGTGLLRIENEAFVDATDNPASASDILTVGVEGRIELDDGWLRTGTLRNNGAIVGDGRIDSAATIRNTGRMETVSGERLVVGNLVENSGSIAAFGGEIDFRAGVDNRANSELTLLNGIVHFRRGTQGPAFDNGGVLAVTGGVSDIYGTVANIATGTIVVAGDSTAVFHDAVTNQGGTIEVFPGSTALFLDDFTMSGASQLLLSLGGTDDQTEIGEVEVAGEALLAGDLAISLVDGFMPAAGDTFQLVTAAKGLGSSLDLIEPPGLPSNLAWMLDVVNGNSLVLSVIEAVLAGDYNANGVVDAADYTIWRDSRGQTGTGLAADGNNDGVVNDADYLVWKNGFGAAASRAGDAGAVPEPGTFWLALGAAFLGFTSRGAAAQRLFRRKTA